MTSRRRGGHTHGSATPVPHAEGVRSTCRCFLDKQPPDAHTGYERIVVAQDSSGPDSVDPGGPLPDQERMILYLLGCGLQIKQVAIVMESSPHTIEKRMRVLRRRFHVRTTGALLCLAALRNLMPSTHTAEPGADLLEEALGGRNGKSGPKVVIGGSALRQELLMIRSLGSGLHAWEVANTLQISTRRVDSQIRSLKRRLGVSTIGELLCLVAFRGLIPGPHDLAVVNANVVR